MSDSEKMGRCRSEITAAYESTRYKPSDSDMLIADAIDRLAADVAAIKAAILPQTTEERDAAISERDEARAEVERLRAELAARPAANSPEIPDSSPADPPPAAPAAWWLTQEERRILSAHVQALRDQRRAMERCGQTLGYIANPCGFKREADAIDALLNRAGSPPVVEVPAMPLEVGDANTHAGQYLRGRRDIAVSYRAALDKAGVAWKAVGRE